MQTIYAQYVDIPNRKTFPAAIIVADGKIKSIEPTTKPVTGFAMPGFVDAHIHIESSMLTPYEFARVALAHGTIATVSDPHEIANVCGMEGVLFMLENARDAKLKFHFGAPSCVPATSFETAGALLSSIDVAQLLARDDIFYLSEMMNYPGVLHGDEEVLKKIAAAKKAGKPVDGHAPGLRGEQAQQYIAAGITTDHECFAKEEALDKLQHGMKIIIREGSAAKNFEALHELISSHPLQVMLCSDDKHPDDLLLGHINQLCARAVAKGHDVFEVLQCACLNAREHYKLRSGALLTGDAADFIVVKDLENFEVLHTFIDGECVAKAGKTFLAEKKTTAINQFNIAEKLLDDFQIPALNFKLPTDVIEAIEGQLITRHISGNPKMENGFVVSNTDEDVLKIAVVNRYTNAKSAVAFIKNFGLKKGALASTVAHDSHNIIAVGVSDKEILAAVNLLIESKGGLCVVEGSNSKVLPLPIAGLMSDKTGEEIGIAYAALDKKVKQLGCSLRAPFMTLSFMALLVIPDLKLSDKGLFSGNEFGFI